MDDKLPITVRYADITDIPRLFRISVEAHRFSYADFIPQQAQERFYKRYTINEENEDRYAKRMMAKIHSSEWRVWVAVDMASGEIAGYTLAHIVAPDFLQKHGLFVHPEHQGKGVGSLLFTTSLSAITSGTVQLSVIENNQKAIHIYQRAGFRRVATDEKTYFDTSQIIMQYNK